MDASEFLFKVTQLHKEGKIVLRKEYTTSKTRYVYLNGALVDILQRETYIAWVGITFRNGKQLSVGWSDHNYCDNRRSKSKTCETLWGTQSRHVQSWIDFSEVYASILKRC